MNFSDVNCIAKDRVVFFARRRQDSITNNKSYFSREIISSSFSRQVNFVKTDGFVKNCNKNIDEADGQQDVKVYTDR